MRTVLFVVVLWLPLMGRSQMPLQVVAKVIEKEIPYSDSQPIELNAQKADVTVKAWNRSMVLVKLRLVAKHPDRAIAEREVAYHQYVLQAENGRIELTNHFVIPQQYGKLKSQLKAVYDVMVPVKALITINNSFGDIRLSGLSGVITINFEFGRLFLDSIGGKLTIDSKYGDIDGHNLAASLIAKTEKADVVLRDLEGDVFLKPNYGKLTLMPAPGLNSLNVEAYWTDILVAVKRVSDFRCDILLRSLTILRVPDALSEQVKRSVNKQTFLYQSSSRKPEIRIHNNYGSLILQGETPLVDR